MPKDANDALRQDPSSIPSMLRQAKTLTHSNIQSFEDLRESVLQAVRKAREFGVRGQHGWQATSLSKLTDICKGFRRRELVLLTGPTGE